MVERNSGFIKRHMPKGRYEEYQAKHAHLVTQTQGEARYIFEKKLDADAKRYARNTFARDLLVTAVLTTGAVFIGRELKNKTLGAALVSIPLRLREVADAIVNQSKEKADTILRHVGAQVAEGAVAQAESHLPHVLEVVREHAPGIGQAAALGALSEVSASLPAITGELESRLKGTGIVIAAQIMATIESGLPHMAETFAASLRSIPGMLFFGSRKK